MRQHRIRTIGLAAAVVIAALAGAAPASAAPTGAPPAGAASAGAAATSQQDDDKVHIVGVLRDTRTDPPSPVEGVLIQVFDEQDEMVGEDRSNPQGRFDIPLPGTTIDVLGNSYRVVLDDETLPKGSYLTDPDAIERTFDIQTDQNYAVNFSIGPDIFAEDPWHEQMSDLAVSGIGIGLLLALAALGL